MRDENVGKLGLVSAATAFGDHRLHGLETMRLVERNGILRKRHDANWKLDGLPRKTPRQSAPIPSLVKLAEILLRLFRQTDPFGDALGDFAMTRQNRHTNLHGFRKSPLNRLCQLRGRRISEGARDGANDCFRELRFVADIDALKVAPERDLVAKRRRQQVTVRVAADRAKKRLMIHVTPNRIVKVQEIGNRMPSTQERSAKSLECPVAKSVA